MDDSIEEVLCWTCDDVAGKINCLLRSEEVGVIFKEQSVNGEVLLELTEEDLKSDLKLNLGQRKIIWKFINGVRSKATVILDTSLLVATVPPEVIEHAQCVNIENCMSPKSPSSSTSSSTTSKEIEKPAADKFTRYLNVKGTLRNHPQGEDLNYILEKGPVSESERRSLVRIVVSELIEAQNNYYPPDGSKEALAKAIVGEYPLLKDKARSELGYEHFFDPISKHGFITYRLWTVQKSLSLSKKKYSGAAAKKRNALKVTEANESVALSERELQEKITWMKFKLPIEAHKTAIQACLAETYENRRQWIYKEKPSIGLVFDTYPRLVDYKGEMIDNEFEMRYPGCGGNFLSNFAVQYSTKILRYASRYRLDVVLKAEKVGVKDDNLKALLILCALLPVSNGSKNRGKGKKRTIDESGAAHQGGVLDAGQIPNPELIIILPEGSNIPLVERSFREAAKNPIQPYMLWVKGQEKSSCFIQGDGWFLMPHIMAPLVAFDVLFKIYHILQVKYPTSLQNFYNFLEYYIYKITSTPNSSVSSLHVNISNFQESDLDV